MVVEHYDSAVKSIETTNGAPSSLEKHWDYFVEHYGVPFGHYLIKLLYLIYINFTCINVALFLIKCVPMVIYVYKFIKSTYRESRQRLSHQRRELEDIQLQLQIVNTKLCCRKSEFAEREEQLRHNIQQLRRVRAQVRHIISEDDHLLQALDRLPPSWNNELHLRIDSTPDIDKEHKFIELLKELKYEQMVSEEQEKDKSVSGGSESASMENSNYASANDPNVNQDCNVKIVKVTNVYKVASLKQFIKRKRLWHANRHAKLNKKMNNIKKLLNNWQKTLNAVINNKTSLLNMDSHRLIIASQEAMGDCSRTNLRDFTDSDTDFTNSADNLFEDYNTSWQNQYFSSCGYDDTVTLDSEIADHDEKYNCQITLIKGSNLSVLPEETKSQMEIEEIRHKTF